MNSLCRWRESDRRAYRCFAGMIGNGLLFLLGISLGLAALAQTPGVDDIAAAFEVRSKNINTISSQLDAATVSSSDLDKLLLTLN